MCTMHAHGTPLCCTIVDLWHVLVFVLGLAFGVQIRDPEVERLDLQVRICYIRIWKSFYYFHCIYA